MFITNRSRHGPIPCAVFVLLAGLLLSAAALAAEPAGRVLVTDGVVAAIDRDGFERPLSRNDVVYPGETLRTGPGGRLQVRFRDDALVDLKPSTAFEIERYREASEREGGSAVMNLLRGAMRTITGAIGKGADDEYAVDTPVATIGIRGTDYSLEFCDAACAGNGRAPGLYGRVDDGAISALTGAGMSSFSAGAYFFVPQGGAPQRIIAPPGSILVDDEDEESEGESVREDEVEGVAITEGEERGEGPGDNPLAARGDPVSTTTDPIYEAGENTAIPRNLSGAVVAGAFRAVNSSGMARHGAGLFDSRDDSTAAWVDASGNLVQITDGSREFMSSLAELDTKDRYSSPYNEVELDWGRWQGSFLIDGDTRVSGDMYFAYTDDWTPASVIDMYAAQEITAAEYGFVPQRDFARLTNTDWSLSALELTADFYASSVGLHLELHNIDGHWVLFDGQNDFNIADGSFGDTLSGELYGSDGFRDEVGGDFQGRFLGRNADGALVAFSFADMADLDGTDGIVVIGPAPAD